jgi:hypothetical protein
MYQVADQFFTSQKDAEQLNPTQYPKNQHTKHEKYHRPEFPDIHANPLKEIHASTIMNAMKTQHCKNHISIQVI